MTDLQYIGSKCNKTSWVDASEIKPGAVFETKALFVNEATEGLPAWRPGFHIDGEYGEEQWCDGYGLVIHEVVAIVDLPKPYKPRVAFKRYFVHPNFYQTQNRSLMFCGVDAFRRKIIPYDEARDMEIVAYTDGQFQNSIGEFDFKKWMATYKAQGRS
tara:strand:+ start:3923 stop:4396 length:474 start_codon:yes stop_codon:yes gene_type:complete